MSKIRTAKLVMTIAGRWMVFAALVPKGKEPEDMAPDGGSSACQACIKINERAIAKIDAYLANPKPPSPRGG